MVPVELADKIIKKEACMNARINVLIQCFGGVDPRHETPLNQMITEITNCMKLLGK